MSIEDHVDVRQLNPETLDQAIDVWTKLDRLVDPKHPRFPDYMALSTKARASYQRIKQMLNVSGGLADIDSTILKLNEMYEEALKIRGEMAVDGIRKDLRVTPGASFEAEIDTKLDAAFTGMPDTERAAIEQRLLPMLYGLGVNGSELREGSVPENFYFMRNGLVDFDKVKQAKTMVQELRNAGAVTPGLLQIADILEAGVKRLEAIDPARAGAYAMYEESNARGMGFPKPLRLAGAIGAGLITAFGLGRFMYASWKNDREGKEAPEFSPLIIGWAAAAMAIVNPKIFTQNGTSKVLEKVANLGMPENRKIIGGGFNDPEALAELQELRGKNPKLLTELSKLDKLSVAQIEALTESTDSPLTRTLTAMSESLRPAVLRQFGVARMDDGEIEIAQTFMKAPGTI